MEDAAPKNVSRPPNERPEKKPVAIPGDTPPPLLRFLAYAVDCVFLAAVLMPTHFLLMHRLLGGVRPEWTFSGPKLWMFVLATFSLPVWIYFTCLDSGLRRGTLGKRLFRLRAVTATGQSIPTQTALIRTAIKLLPWEVVHASLMLPIPAFDAEHSDVVSRPGMMVQFFLVASWVVTVLVTEGNRAVHDIVLRTFVVRAGSERTPPPEESDDRDDDSEHAGQ